MNGSAAPALFVKERNGRYAPAPEEVILNAASEVYYRGLKRAGPLRSPDATKDFLSRRLAHRECEYFSVLFLDNRHRIIAFEEMFRGTINGSVVHSREVVKAALGYNAAAVMFAHNHPSGVAEPSADDRKVTKLLVEALKLVDVRVLDHFVVGAGEIVSFAARGLL